MPAAWMLDETPALSRTCDLKHLALAYVAFSKFHPGRDSVEASIATAERAED